MIGALQRQSHRSAWGRGLAGPRRTLRGLWVLAAIPALASCGVLPHPLHAVAATVRAQALPSPTSTSPSDGSGTVDDSQRHDDLQTVLDARAAAITAHDRTKFAASLADPTNAFGRRQLAAFDLMVQLPIAGFEYDDNQLSGSTTPAEVKGAGKDAWVADVTAHYRFTGYDGADHTFGTSYTVVKVGSSWKLADDSVGESQAQPWDLPGATIATTPTTLVIGNVSAATVKSYATTSDKALTAVRSIWKRAWPGRVVVVAPKDTNGMKAQLDWKDLDTSQIAAVTQSPPNNQDRGLTDRVVLNPRAFARMSSRGQLFVLTHEFTHVATGATVSGHPSLWLSEGLADYVAWKANPIPVPFMIQDLTDQVKAHGIPAHLPTDSEFRTGDAIGVAYNGGFLAVSMIADQAGMSGLMHFYDVAASLDPNVSETNADTAFKGVLHSSRAAFIKKWQARIKKLTT